MWIFYTGFYGGKCWFFSNNWQQWTPVTATATHGPPPVNATQSPVTTRHSPLTGNALNARHLSASPEVPRWMNRIIISTRAGLLRLWLFLRNGRPPLVSVARRIAFVSLRHLVNDPPLPKAPCPSSGDPWDVWGSVGLGAHLKMKLLAFGGDSFWIMVLFEWRWAHLAYCHEILSTLSDGLNWFYIIIHSGVPPSWHTREILMVVLVRVCGLTQVWVEAGFDGRSCRQTQHRMA